MRLTRRDAVAALAAAGIAIGGGSAVMDALNRDAPADDDGQNPHLSEETLETVLAAAEVLYPSELTDIETFVSQYMMGRAADSQRHARGVATAVEYLESYADAWYDEQFTALDVATRSEALRSMNAETADPDPEGSDVERVRYYIVNELLFALYTSPTGGKLVGLENPQGHPGGLGSYQRGPPS